MVRRISCAAGARAVRSQQRGTFALVAEERARILAQAGEVDAALDEIEQLLAGPGYLSVHTLLGQRP